MYKGRSKSKMKQSTAFMKKQCEEKQKKYSKDLMKRSQIKQNLDTLAKFNMTSIQSKKKNKPSGGVDTSRSISPLCTNIKKNQSYKNEDEKFIQKLFSQNMDELAKVFFIEDLIQGLVPNQKKNTKQQSHTHNPSIDILRQLHLKNQQVASLQQQLQQLKLYVSNFTFKVFDLTVLCRRHNMKISNQQQNLQFNRSTDEVIAYLDSLVRHWKLQSKMKLHCQTISKRLSIPSQKSKMDDVKKRCHTQSLKIPIQQYLQSLQNTAGRKLFPKQLQKKDCQQQQSEQIMRILSRRSSGRKRQQEQTYVVLRQYKARNQNQLDLSPGQTISVLQKNGNQRWLGYKQGKIGYFQKQCLF